MNFEDDLIEFSTLTPSAANTPAMPVSRRNRSAPRPSFGRRLAQSSRPPPQTNPQIRLESQPQIATAAADLVGATPGYLRTPNRRSALRNATGRPSVSMNRVEQLRRTAPSFAPSGTDSEMSSLDGTITPDVSTTPIGLPPTQQPATKDFTRTPLFGRHRESGFGMRTDGRPAGIAGTNGARASRFATSTRFSTISDVDEAEETRNSEVDGGLAGLESPSRFNASSALRENS